MGLITINGLRNGIIQNLNYHFPETEIYNEDSGQQPQKPYFLVKLLKGSQTQEMGARYRRVCQFDIQYFGTGSQGLYDVAETLYGAVEQVEVDGVRLPASGMSHETIDGILHFPVNYAFLLRKDTPQAPVMQTVEQGGYVK